MTAHHNPVSALQQTNASQLLTVNGAASYLNVSRWTVYRLVRSDHLTPLHVGNRLRFRVSDIDRYLQRPRTPA